MATDSLAAPTRRSRLRERRWWPAVKRTATALFLALVAWLVYRQARTVVWAEVWQSVRDYPVATLALAALLALSSHALYATFDLLSRRYAGHTLPTGRVMLTTFISYAFNLNFGSLVGGVGFRFRLYSQQGLAPPVISRIFAFSMLTNWLGYTVLAGVLAMLQPLEVPPEWSIGMSAMRVAGAIAVAVGLVYVALCAWSPRRDLTLRGHTLHLPGARMALLQLAVSMLNWALIGGTIYVLLREHVAYPAALATLLAAAVAGVITHVPAGLGVLEAVFIALLSPPVASSPLLAALLVYRALYYLLPLAVALVAYVAFELRLRRAGAVPV